MKNNNLTYIATRVFETPLLIRPAKLGVILDVLGPRLGLEGPIKIDGLMFDDDEDEDPGEGKSYAVTKDGIACIPIQGTLVKTAGWLDALSGMTSYARITSQFRDAMRDSAIKGVLLCMDTPGGEVSGLFDLVDEIYASRATKPVYAISDDSAFSAGYAIASAAEKIFVTRTGGLGSIGVIAVHVDQSKADEMKGLAYTAVYAGAHKNDFSSHAPLSDEAKASLQTEIDRCYGMFVSTVARNRSMAEAAVKDTEAQCFWGDNCLSVGLADRVGNCDDALSVMRQVIASQRTVRVAASAEAQIPREEVKMETEEQNKQADATKTAAAPSTPAATTAPDTNAALAALQAEQDEIIELCELVGQPNLATQAIKDRLTLKQVREKIKSLKAEQSRQTASDTSNTAASASSAEALLNQTAQQLATSKGISFASAYVAALNQNPKLYNEYLEQKKAQQKV